MKRFARPLPEDINSAEYRMLAATLMAIAGEMATHDFENRLAANIVSTFGRYHQLLGEAPLNETLLHRYGRRIISARVEANFNLQLDAMVRQTIHDFATDHNALIRRFYPATWHSETPFREVLLPLQTDINKLIQDHPNFLAMMRANTSIF